MKFKSANLIKAGRKILGAVCALSILTVSMSSEVFAADVKIPKNSSVSRGTGDAPRIYESINDLIKEIQNSSLSSTEKQIQINILNTRKNNAITQSDIDKAFSRTIPNLMEDVLDEPSDYGLTNSKLKNAYFGEDFGYLILGDDYVTDDDTVKYYPICYDRRIIGILTLTKADSKVTCQVGESYADELTDSLIETDGEDVVLLKKDDTIFRVDEDETGILYDTDSTTAEIPEVKFKDVRGARINTVNAQILTKTYNLDGTKDSSSDKGVRQFVTRLYEKALKRSASDSEITGWANQLTNKTNDGANAAYGFVFSREFINRNLSNETYVDTLYSTMFDRAADSGGKANWLKLLSNGLSREYVFKGFAESQEFTALCTSYNINRGSVVLNSSRDQNAGVTMFAYRCYSKALGRTADIDGLNHWCYQLLSRTSTPRQVAYGFIFSQEMKNKYLSNTEFTKVLYRVFLDREYDQYGLNNWVNQLNSGISREQVFNGFANSQEFASLAASYGLSA